MIYATIKNYDRALYFFQVAITTPSMAVSHIMLEAYKKYILVSLILQGKVPSPPKYTSQVVARFIKPLSQPYMDLATAYSSNNAEELNSIITKHNEVFVRVSETKKYYKFTDCFTCLGHKYGSCKTMLIFFA